MLPNINRIKKKKDFAVIFKKGKSVKNNLLILKVAENHFGQLRFGFVISQKVSKKAVIRNKIRRRLVEIVKKNTFTKNLTASKKDNGLDIIFIGLPSIKNSSFLEIKNAVESLINKTSISHYV